MLPFPASWVRHLHIMEWLQSAFTFCRWECVNYMVVGLLLSAFTDGWVDKVSSVQIYKTWTLTLDLKANSAFHPSRVGKWVPASAGKAKAGMVHSVSGWTRGVQVKLWDPLWTRAIPQRLRCVFTTRRYTNPRLPLPLHWAVQIWFTRNCMWWWNQQLWRDVSLWAVMTTVN